MTEASHKAFKPIDEATTSDLMFRLGKLVEARPGVIERPEQGSTHTWSSDARPLEGLALDCSVRVPLPAPRPHNAAFAAELRADNDETGQLMDAAWERFRQHRDRKRYGAECKRIIERPALRARGSNPGDKK